MNRKWMILLHLGLGSLFLPLMLIMPLTGSLHIFGVEDDQEKVEAFTISDPLPEDKNALPHFFKEQFKKQNIKYHFEYLRASGSDFIFRPTTKIFYSATKVDNQVKVFKITPSFFKRLMELHKGHGPKIMRWFEGIFGIALILVTLSGIWLSITVKSYRTITLGCFALGCAILAACLF